MEGNLAELTRRVEALERHAHEVRAELTVTTGECLYLTMYLPELIDHLFKAGSLDRQTVLADLAVFIRSLRRPGAHPPALQPFSIETAIESVENLHALLGGKPLD